MNLKSIKNLIFVFAILIQFTGCKKESVPVISKLDLITKSAWQINTAEFNPGIGALTVFKKGGTGNLLDVSKIKIVFNKDFTVTGTNQDGANLSGKWSFSADESKVNMPDGLPFKEVNLEQLTEKNFDIYIPAFKYEVASTLVSGVLTIKMIPVI